MDDLCLDTYGERLSAMLQSFENACRESDSEPIEQENEDILDDIGSGDFASFESPSSSPIPIPQQNTSLTTDTHPSDRGPILFVMNVKVPGGRFPLEIHENDLPEDLACEFCRTHSIPETVVPQLKSLIEHHRKEFGYNNVEDNQISKSNKNEILRPHPPTEPPPRASRSSSFRRGRRRKLNRKNKKRKRKKRTVKTKPQQIIPTSPSDGEDMIEQFQAILDNHFRTIGNSVKRPKKRARSVPAQKRKKKRGRNVFNRLHKEHAKRTLKLELARAKASRARQRKYASRKVTLSKGSERMINSRRPRGDVGERLYKLAKKKQHDLIIKQKTVQRERERKEIEEVTFHPEISQLARTLNRCGSKLWKRIIDPMGEENRQIIHDLRERIIQEEMQQCPFHPKVNAHSSELAGRVRSNEGLYDRLYQESVTNFENFLEKKREADVRKKYPFHPKISEKSIEIARFREPRPPNSRRNLRKGSYINIKSRFRSTCQSKTFKPGQRLRVVGFDGNSILVNNLGDDWGRDAVIAAKDLHKIEPLGNFRKRHLRDPHTGQRLFQPVINERSRKLQRLRRQKADNFNNVGEYLHEVPVGHVEEGTVCNSKTLTFSPKLCKKSRAITNCLDEERHQEIWLAIAGDKESISVMEIQNLSALLPRDAMVVCDMLNDLVNNGSSDEEPLLTMDAFASRFAEYEKKHPSGPRFHVKRDLVDYNRAESPQFTPVLSPKAQKLKRKSEDVFENLYAVAEQQREIRQQKVETKFEEAKQQLQLTLNGAQSSIRVK